MTSEEEVRWVAHLLWVEAGMPKEGASTFYGEARGLINATRQHSSREQHLGAEDDGEEEGESLAG